MRKMAMLVLMLVAMFAVAVPPAYAFDEAEQQGCTDALLDCFEGAALIDDFWRRWAAGIDCELDFIECARIKIIGR